MSNERLQRACRPADHRSAKGGLILEWTASFPPERCSNDRHDERRELAALHHHVMRRAVMTGIRRLTWTGEACRPAHRARGGRFETDAKKNTSITPEHLTCEAKPRHGCPLSEMSKPQSATSLAVCGSYRTSAMEPSLIRSTASSMTNSGTRNHSLGTTAFPRHRYGTCC